MKHKKGFTLIEILIYCSLFMFVMSAVFGVLLGSLRYFKTIDTLISLQKSVVISLSMVTRDLTATKGTLINTSSNPQGVMFPSYKSIDGKYTFDNDGQTKWQKWVCYYTDQNKNLVRKEVAISPVSGTPPKPSGLSSVSSFANSSQPGRQVARNIEKFSVSLNSTTGNYEINIIADDSENKNKPNQIDIKTELSIADQLQK
jgi:Tfp pilus assembly protein PilW